MKYWLAVLAMILCVNCYADSSTDNDDSSASAAANSAAEQTATAQQAINQREQASKQQQVKDFFTNGKYQNLKKYPTNKLFKIKERPTNGS